MQGIEIDHGDADLSAGIHNGQIEIMFGEDWSGRHHGPDRPQGYMRSLLFRLTKAEAKNLCEWLTGAINAI